MRVMSLGLFVCGQTLKSIHWMWVIFLHKVGGLSTQSSSETLDLNQVTRIVFLIFDNILLLLHTEGNSTKETERCVVLSLGSNQLKGGEIRR